MNALFNIISDVIGGYEPSSSSSSESSEWWNEMINPSFFIILNRKHNRLYPSY